MKQIKSTKTKNIESLVRGNVLQLKPYSSARDEFEGQADVYLDANENPFESGLNRYPDPYQKKLKSKLEEIKKVSSSKMLLGNGSDEVLDLLFRVFCQPGKDNIVTTPPTYGMYKVLADINNVEIKEAPLNNDFGLNIKDIMEKVDANTKILFLCSPNNPSGNCLNENDINFLLNELDCIVVIDEAYIDFSEQESWSTQLDKYPNLVICQTLSKSWGLAGIRLGICYGSDYIIELLNKIKPPYNINQLTQEKAFETLNNIDSYKKELEEILKEKETLKLVLQEFSFVKKVYPSDANFWLVKVNDANKLYQFLAAEGVITRNRNNQYGCENCLRITVGTSAENKKLIEKLKLYQA